MGYMVEDGMIILFQVEQHQREWSGVGIYSCSQELVVQPLQVKDVCVFFSTVWLL